MATVVPTMASVGIRLEEEDMAVMGVAVRYLPWRIVSVLVSYQNGCSRCVQCLLSMFKSIA